MDTVEAPAPTVDMPLRQLRIDAGKTLKDVVEQGKTLTDKFPKSIANLCNLERRGTENYFILTALASIYEKPLSEILRVATPEK